MSNTRRWPSAVVVAALVCGLAPGPAAAQDRLFVGTGEIGAFGRFGDRIGDAPGAVHGRLVAGGRYVVSGSAFETSPPVFDTRTGAVVPTPPGRVLEVDPIRPRIFVKDGLQLSVWDLERQARTSLPATFVDDLFGIIAAAYAPDSDELFVRSLPPNATALTIAVVDVGRAVEVRTLTLGTDFAYPWRVTPDGARLVVPYTGRLVLYEGRTGAQLAEQPLVSVTTPVYDARFERWYHATVGALTAFDRDLGLIATVPLDLPGCGSQAAVSLHTDRLYLVHGIGRSGSSSSTPMRLPLTVFDTTNGQLIGSHDVTTAAGIAPNTLRCRLAPVSVLTAPGPPRGLTAVVSGRDVTLSWSRVGDATDFVLDISLAAVQGGVRFSVGPSSPVTFTGVPAGTYYARLHGTNRFGTSRASEGIFITVP